MALKALLVILCRMGRSTKRSCAERALAARGEGHPFLARGSLEPERKQITVYRLPVSQRGASSDSGLATTEEQAEELGVMVMSDPLAKLDG